MSHGHPGAGTQPAPQPASAGELRQHRSPQLKGRLRMEPLESGNNTITLIFPHRKGTQGSSPRNRRARRARTGIQCTAPTAYSQKCSPTPAEIIPCSHPAAASVVALSRCNSWYLEPLVRAQSILRHHPSTTKQISPPAVTQASLTSNPWSQSRAWAGETPQGSSPDPPPLFPRASSSTQSRADAPG